MLDLAVGAILLKGTSLNDAFFTPFFFPYLFYLLPKAQCEVLRRIKGRRGEREEPIFGSYRAV